MDKQHSLCVFVLPVHGLNSSELTADLTPGGTSGDRGPKGDLNGYLHSAVGHVRAFKLFPMEVWGFRRPFLSSETEYCSIKKI